MWNFAKYPGAVPRAPVDRGERGARNGGTCHRWEAKSAGIGFSRCVERSQIARLSMWVVCLSNLLPRAIAVGEFARR